MARQLQLRDGSLDERRGHVWQLLSNVLSAAFGDPDLDLDRRVPKAAPEAPALAIGPAILVPAGGVVAVPVLGPKAAAKAKAAGKAKGKAKVAGAMAVPKAKPKAKGKAAA